MITTSIRDLCANAFRTRRVLVVGDVILDAYLHGEVHRISPEAPVPILRLRRREFVAGGAANVALNLAGLGCQTGLIGVIGDDSAAATLSNSLRGLISQPILLSVAGFPTIVKTRVVGFHQQMIRIDEEDPAALDTSAWRSLVDAVKASVPTADAVILSDYAKGVLHPSVASAAIAESRRKGIPIIVDPKGIEWEHYRNATAITPNVAELAAVARLPLSDLSGLHNAAVRLRRDLNLDFLAFTRGEHGIDVVTDSGITHYPAQAKEVFDVSGAGDTVIAVIAAGLSASASVDTCIRLANIAAGIVVGKAGTTPIDAPELVAALDDSGMTSVDVQRNTVDSRSSLEQIAAWQRDGRTIAFTNGCFDLVHAGHIKLLKAAKSAADKLVVGLNSDDSVRRLKGKTRPINSAADRAEVLLAIEAVDAVLTFDEDTPLRLINELRPNILVKGADYTEDQVVGGAEVKAWGGKVLLVDLLPGRSSTHLIEQIAQ